MIINILLIAIGVVLSTAGVLLIIGLISVGLINDYRKSQGLDSLPDTFVSMLLIFPYLITGIGTFSFSAYCIVLAMRWMADMMNILDPGFGLYAVASIITVFVSLCAALIALEALHRYLPFVNKE